MAIDKKDIRKPSISAAEPPISTPVDAKSAQNRATLPALKGQIASTLKRPEQDAEFQRHMADLQQQSSLTTAPDEDTTQYRRWTLIQSLLGDNITDINPLTDWVKENPAKLGENFDINNPTDRAYAEFRRANENDDDIVGRFETENMGNYYYNPRIPSRNNGADRNSNYSVADDGFKPPRYKLDPNQARQELARDIRTVSTMYAGEAGMAEKDFAKVLGGIATIESRFGVLRSIPEGATAFKSSAGGAFHFLDGTVAAEVRQSSSDPRVTKRVAELGVNIGDGIGKGEAWTLKDDNILAGSLVAKNIIKAIQKRPDLRNDPEALATFVYQSHNLGDAGARALARGGRDELERVSKAADDNNPMFFRGAKSDTEINNRYTKFVTGAMASASPLIEATFLATEAPVIASAAPARKPVHAAAFPAPQPS